MKTLAISLAACTVFYMAGCLHGVYWSTHNSTKTGEWLTQLGLRLLAANVPHRWDSVADIDGKGGLDCNVFRYDLTKEEKD